MDIDSKLSHAFQIGLGLDAKTPFNTLEFAKNEHWDSIAHMKLIAAIEEEFAIRLEVNDILGMSSYPIARDIVNKYLEI